MHPEPRWAHTLDRSAVPVMQPQQKKSKPAARLPQNVRTPATPQQPKANTLVAPGMQQQRRSKEASVPEAQPRLLKVKTAAKGASSPSQQRQLRASTPAGSDMRTGKPAASGTHCAAEAKANLGSTTRSGMKYARSPPAILIPLPPPGGKSMPQREIGTKTVVLMLRTAATAATALRGIPTPL